MTAMEKKDKTLNVPHMRFPEFSGEWDHMSLSDIADIVGGGTPDTSVVEYWGGNIQWFTPSEIGKEKYARLSERTITEAGIKNSSAKLLPQGTVLLSSRATIGECSIARQECTTNQGFQSLIAEPDKVTSEFLYYLVPTIKKEMLRRSCGSTFLEISANELRKIYVYRPSLIEQNKLAEFMSLLDLRIETQKKLIEDLKKLKDAIRTKLFRHIESTCVSYDEIRNMLDYEQPSGYLVSSTEYSDNYQTPVLTANKAFILGYTDEVHGIYDNGECIILDDFTMDVKYVTFPFKVKSSAIKILTAKKDMDLYFMYEYLLHLGLVSEEHKRHYISEIEPMTLSRPTLQEQKRISQTLKALDMQVQSANRLNDLLLKQRKYITSQMFI